MGECDVVSQDGNKRTSGKLPRCILNDEDFMDSAYKEIVIAQIKCVWAESEWVYDRQN